MNRPIQHRNFRCAVDIQQVDPEDVENSFLAKTTNLQPFRKYGSLVKAPGHSLKELNGLPMEKANLPSPEGYTLVQQHYFSIDRDAKEVTFLVYEDSLTKDVKMYINPYWNPDNTNSNFNAAEAQSSWINKWLELTERYEAKLNGDGSTTQIDLKNTSVEFDAKPDDYFNGFFLLNVSLGNTYDEMFTKHNFVQDYDSTLKRITTKVSTSIAGKEWMNDHNVRLYRFPVRCYFKAETPNPTNANYLNRDAPYFTQLPTQLFSAGNQLRIACGKEARPLVLDMLYKKSFFSDATYSGGYGPVKYDGFWFDFQQPQQVLYKSAISAWEGTTEAGGNRNVSNLFLGAHLELDGDVVPNSTGSYKQSFISTLILDGRNEVVLGSGVDFHPPIGDPKIQLKFNWWFSRKITHYDSFMNAAAGLTSVINVTNTDKYPYINWNKIATINEAPSDHPRSIDRFDQGFGAEIWDSNRPFTYSNAGGYWNYSKLVSGSGHGTGLKFIVKTNRFIDQDTTMNYTRIAHVGMTNGRFFISGCKNTVEFPEFENDDAVFYSNFAVGVSAYDLFFRDKVMFISPGSKEVNVDLQSMNGYLSIIKDANVYLADVNTSNELDYRIIDTVHGRGARSYNHVCKTPYGIIICSTDTVWLVTNQDVIPLLLPTNGRLQLYLDKFSEADVKCVFYQKKNELMIFNVNRSEEDVSRVLVYNFTAKMWTDYSYKNPILITDITVDSDKNVVLLNYSGEDHNIIKIDEDAKTFLNPDSEPQLIEIEFETLKFPYGGYVLDTTLNWIQLAIDYAIESDSELTTKVYFDDDVDAAVVNVTLTNTLGGQKNDLINLLINSTLSKTVYLNIKNVNLSNDVQDFSTLNINTVITYIDGIKERKITK